MNRAFTNALCMAFAIFVSAAATAAVPLSWEVKPGQASPVAFDRFHGESLQLSAEFVGFGEPPFAPGADVRLWYQTNGMGSAWWSVPASVESNRVSAVWSPELDPGAERVNLFFGAPSNAYCSAVLRLRGSPGMVPNVLPLPVQRLDFAALEVTNAPYYTQTETDAKIVELAPAPGNYAAVSNAAMSASAATNDFVRKHGDTVTGTLTVKGAGISTQKTTIGNTGISTPNITLGSSMEMAWLYPWCLTVRSEYAEDDETFYYPVGSGGGTIALTKNIDAAAAAATNHAAAAAASAYADATNNAAQAYVKKSGDTMSGKLYGLSAGLSEFGNVPSSFLEMDTGTTAYGKWYVKCPALNQMQLVCRIGANYATEYVLNMPKFESRTNGGTLALRSEIPSCWPYTAITNAPWLTSYVESDPTVPAWAKETNPPLPEDYAAVSNAAMSAANATNDFVRKSGGTIAGTLSITNSQGDAETGAHLVVNGDSIDGPEGEVTIGPARFLGLDFYDWSEQRSEPILDIYDVDKTYIHGKLFAVDEIRLDVSYPSQPEIKDPYLSMSSNGFRCVAHGQGRSDGLGFDAEDLYRPFIEVSSTEQQEYTGYPLYKYKIKFPEQSGTVALIGSPAFTGTPTAPDITAQSPDGQVANKKYVDGKVSTAGDETIAGHKTFSGPVTVGTRYEGATPGAGSFSQGLGNNAHGNYASCNGVNTTADGTGAHAGGYNGVAAADYSHTEGWECVALPQAGHSHAEGRGTITAGEGSHADGFRTMTAESGTDIYTASNPHRYSYVWQGWDGISSQAGVYHSHGHGTFNIKPLPQQGSADPATGFWIGDKNLPDLIRDSSAVAMKFDVSEAADEFSPSNTYAVGSAVAHEGRVYICTTAVTTVGAWNAANWTHTTLAGLLARRAPLVVVDDEIDVAELTEARRNGNDPDFANSWTRYVPLSWCYSYVLNTSQAAYGIRLNSYAVPGATVNGITLIAESSEGKPIYSAELVRTFAAPFDGEYDLEVTIRAPQNAINLPRYYDVLVDDETTPRLAYRPAASLSADEERVTRPGAVVLAKGEHRLRIRAIRHSNDNINMAVRGLKIATNGH